MDRLVFFAVLSLLLAGCGSDGSADDAARAPDSGPAAAADGGAAIRSPVDTGASDDAATDSGVSAASIIAQEFAYGATDERNFVGYFAMPEEIIEPLPGVVLIHERWGLNDAIEATARELAAAGYAVLAVDLYNRQTADDATAAQTLTGQTLADRAGAIDNIGQAIDYLRAYALAPRVALVGYGLGGGLALEASFAMPAKVDAVVTYYGNLLFDDAELEKLRVPLMGIYAEQDESIPLRRVQEFRLTLREKGKEAEVLIYAGAAHGFADRARSTFNADAVAESWDDMLAFLGAHIATVER